MSSTEAPTPVQAVVERLRGPAAVLLLAVNGVLLLVGLLAIATSSLDVSDALATSRGSFLGLTQVLLPVVAVLLVAVVRPTKDKLAPLVSMIALGELAFSVLLGLITSLSIFAASYSTAGSKFASFLEGIAWVALTAAVAFFVLQVLMAARGAAAPAGAQGGYGAYPGAQGQGYDTGARPAAPYGGQAGYPGQPQQPQPQPGGEWPGQQQPGQDWGQPAQPQPGQDWGQPVPSGQPTQAWNAQPSWPGQQPGQQPGQVQPQSGPPQAGQWSSQVPTSGQPAPFTPPSSGVPYGQPSSGVPYGQQPSSGVPYGYQGQQPGYGSAHQAAPTSGFPQPTSGYPNPGSQETNIVNVNDLLPPDQQQHRGPRHGE
ncbi:hypothetical protein GCM10009539_63200 [Cryptosporangium japonicum]|uniref:Uncharacterized protein n=1 Tax=Cryptosporangium japonicum TaxID=80872 RepID=A0ABP3EKR1_9ACTN